MVLEILLGTALRLEFAVYDRCMPTWAASWRRIRHEELALALLLAACSLAPSYAQSTALQAAGTISLPNVEGRIDHLSVDLDSKRLFVAALGNNTMEVVDIAGMRVAKSVSGLHEPQGIRYLPESRRVVVANGDDG